MNRLRLPARARSGLLPVLLTGLVVLGGAAPASAQTVTDLDDLVAQLDDDRVAVSPGFRVPLDEAALRSALSGTDEDVYVAAVTRATAEAAGSPYDVALAVGESLRDEAAVVLVISDQPAVDAANSRAAAARGIDAEAAAVAADRGGAFTGPNVTALVRDFVDEIDRQSAGGGSGGGTGSSSSGSGGLLAVLGLGALGFGGYALLASRRRARSRSQELEDLRADVESLYGRLGNDVSTLAPGDDDIARQALADASERYTATGALLSKADTPGEFAAARRTAVEGITAARVVRSRLGLDPGPDVPMPEGDGPKLTESSRVQVGEDEYEGSPSYEPGRPHYYEGGYYGGQAIPGGWYATPFWQSLLLGSLMGGGRSGGGIFGGGYGGGYGGGGYGGGLSGGMSGGIGGGVFGGRRRGGGGGGFGGLGGGGRRSGGGWGGGGGGGGGWGRGGGGGGWGRGGGGGWGRGGGGGRRRSGGGW